MANSMFEQYANQAAEDMFADFDTNNVTSQDKDEDEEVTDVNPFRQNAEQYATDMFADIEAANEVVAPVVEYQVQPEAVTPEAVTPEVSQFEAIEVSPEKQGWGELGGYKNSANGGISTELTITVNHPELNQGRPTVIPSLVAGQTDIDNLLNLNITEQHEEIAVKRAIQRQNDGMNWPSFMSIELANSYAEERSASKTDSAIDYSLDQAEKMLGRGAQVFAELTGAEPIAQWAKEYVAKQDKDIAEGGYKSSYVKGSLRDTFNEDGFGAAVGYVAESIVENSVSSGTAIVGTGAAAIAVAFSAPAWIPLTIGGATLVSSGVMGSGETALEMEDKGVDVSNKKAAGVGVLIGILDKFGAGKLIPKGTLANMSGNAVIKSLVDSGFVEAAKAVAKTIGIKVGTEIGTENVQEGAMMVATASQGGEYTQKEVIDRIIDTTFISMGMSTPTAVISTAAEVSSAKRNPQNPVGSSNTSGETLEDVYSDMARREVDKSEAEAAAKTQKTEPAIPDTGEWGVFPNVGGSYSVLNPATGENAGTFDSEQEAESVYQSKVVEALTQELEPAIPDAPTSEAPDIANVEVDINAQRAELDNDLAEVDQGLAAARAALREEPRTSIPPTSDLQTDTEVAVAPDLEADPFADIPDGLPQLEADALTITADDLAQMDLDDSENQVQIDQEIAAFNASTAAIPTELPPVASVKNKPKSKTQTAAEKAQSAAQRKLVDPTKDDLLTAIAKSGGVKREEASSEDFDSGSFVTRKAGLRTVFRAKPEDGLSFDAMRENLSQYGYIDPNSTVNDFVDLLQKAVRGETVVSNRNENYIEQQDAQRLDDFTQQGGVVPEAPAPQASVSSVDQTLTSALEEARNGNLPESEINSILTNYPKESDAVLQLQMSMGLDGIGDSSGSNQTARVGDLRPERNVQQGEGDRGLAGSSTDVATGSSNNGSQNGTDEMGVLLSPSMPSRNTIADSEAGSGGGINNAGLSGAVDAGSSSLAESAAKKVNTAKTAVSVAKAKLSSIEKELIAQKAYKEETIKGFRPDGLVDSYEGKKVEAIELKKTKANESLAAAEKALAKATPFDLETQTEESLAADTEQAATASAEQAAKTKTLSDRAKADAELGVFKLTGSDAPADVAVASGQDDMFDADSNGTGQSTGDPLFSKSAILDSNAKPKGVSQAAIKKRLAVFLDKYKGADNVQVWIRDTQDDAFGPGSTATNGPIKAGYYPEQDAVVFVAENINSLQDIDATIQHELLVHKGLGLFEKSDVNGLIEVIKENAPKSGPLSKMWEDVKKDYADKPIEKQVEELIAKVAEKKMSKPDKYWNKIITVIRDMLRKIGFVKEISFSDLRKRVYDMGDAFAQGRRAETREGYESKANETKSPSLDGLSGSDVLNSKKGGMRPGEPLIEGSNRPDKNVTSKTSDTLGFTTNDKDVNAVIPKVEKGNGKPDITIYGVTAGGQRALVAKPRANGWDITVDRRVTGEMFTDGKPREYTAKNRKQVEERVESLGLTLETVIPETPGNLPPVGGELLDAVPEWQSKPVTLLEQFRFKAQDKFINLMKNQKIIEEFSGERLAEDVDAYDAEAVYHGKAESQLSNFKDDVLKPTMKYMVENDLTIEDVGDYMYALHAKEANAALKEKYEGQPDSDRKSGMTDEDASKILADAKDSGKLDALNEVAQTMYEVVEKSRKILVRSGLQSEEVVQTWRDQYQNYVPLWGDPSDPSGAIKFKEETERKGRNSRADNVLVNLIVQHEKVIVRAEKNHVRRTLLKLAEQNPNKDFWQINTPEVVQVLDPVTQLFIDKTAPTKKGEDNVVTVAVDGVQHEITFNELDKNAMNIARSMKNLSVKDMNIAIKTGMMVNRWVSATVTQFSPEFLPTNVIRDLQTAIINLAAVEGVDTKMIGRIAKNVKKSIKGIREHQKGRKGSEESVWYEEFYNEGAQTGWLDSYETMTARAFSLELLMKQNRYMTLSAANRFVEYVQDMNTAYENGVRLSTYIELRKAGVSKLKAANAAKNLTVNFNRKGDSALAANAMYIFYNAGVQGTAVIARTLTHKKARRMMYALAALSASNEMLNRLLSGEDEDEQSAYSKIPHYIRDTNHVFVLPDFFGENDVSDRWYVTIPLSYGYNVISTTASVVAGSASTLMGNKDYDAADPGVAFTRTLGAFMHGFNPVGGNSSLTQFISPTILDTYFQLEDNENFAGNPIMPKDNPFGPQTPDSLKAWESSPEYLKEIMFELNEITTGDEVRSGWFDVSPETVEHWAGFLTGSAGRFVKNVFIDLPYKFINDEETSYRDYPFFRKFFKQIGDSTDRENYYRAMNDIDVAGKHRTIGLDKSKEGDDTVLTTVVDGYINVVKLKLAAQGFKKRIKFYNDAIDLIEEDKTLSTKNRRFKIKVLEKKRRSDMMTLVSMYRKAAAKDSALRDE